MTQEFPNQTSSPLWTSESVRLEKLAWRQELGRRAIARSRMNRVCLMLLIWLAVFSQLSSTGVVLLSFLQLDIPAWLTGVGRLAAALRPPAAPSAWCSSGSAGRSGRT